MTSRLKKATYSTIVGLGLFAGAAGVTAAASGGRTPAPNLPAESVNQTNDNEADEDGDVNCENGIDTATGAECDGGPAAAQADEANETGEANEANETGEANEANETGEVNETGEANDANGANEAGESD